MLVGCVWVAYDGVGRFFPPSAHKHKHIQVFAKYKTLLSSDNYVTKRMSLKLLGEILLDRSNFNVMCVRASVMLPRNKTHVDSSPFIQLIHANNNPKYPPRRMKFISSKENLKTIMLLLRDKSPAIQFEVRTFGLAIVGHANRSRPSCLAFFSSCHQHT